LSDKYFVILHDQHGGGMPMTSDEYGQQLTLFDSFEEASEAGSANALGRACGFEVHDFDNDGCGY